MFVQVFMVGILLAKPQAKLQCSFGDYLNSLKAAPASALGQPLLPG